MTIESDEDLVELKIIGRIVADTLQYMGECLEPGMTTRELDDLGRAYLDRHGARSAPELVYKFPGATCISLNNQVAHGIPGSTRIEAGDLVNIDVSAERNGYFADTGASFVVPPQRPQLMALYAATREALEQAMKVTRSGAKLNGIGKAIEKVARAGGYTIIRNLASHGVGRALHEEPLDIPGFFVAGDARVLQKGTVMTIEPFLSTRATVASDGGDGWTLVVSRKHRCAQYEHTLVVTDGDPIVLTQPSISA